MNVYLVFPLLWKGKSVTMKNNAELCRVSGQDSLPCPGPFLVENKCVHRTRKSYLKSERQTSTLAFSVTLLLFEKPFKWWKYFPSAQDLVRRATYTRGRGDTGLARASFLLWLITPFSHRLVSCSWPPCGSVKWGRCCGEFRGLILRFCSMKQGLSQTCYVEQAGLELRGQLASAPQVLGLKACATKSSPIFNFYYYLLFRLLKLTIISNLKNAVATPLSKLRSRRRIRLLTTGALSDDSTPLHWP